MPNRIDQDISAQTYASVYVMYGVEGYLTRYYRKKLRNALIPSGMEMNLNVFQGADTDVDEIISLADTMPMFAQHRLIIIDSGGLFAKGGQALADYLPHMPETTVLLFTEEGKPDERGKLFKAVKKIGVVLEMKTPGSAALEKWIVRAFDRAGKQITRSALNQLLQNVGTDMQTLHNEIEKLIAYTGDNGGVRLEDVQAVTTAQTESRIFEMADAIATGQTEKAVRDLRDLLALKESPAGILSLLMGYFNLIFQVRDLRDQGFDSASVYEKIHIQAFRVRNALRQSEQFTSQELKDILTLYVDAFRMITTGQMDPAGAVELAVVRSSRARTRGRH